MYLDFFTDPPVFVSWIKICFAAGQKCIFSNEFPKNLAFKIFTERNSLTCSKGLHHTWCLDASSHAPVISVPIIRQPGQKKFKVKQHTSDEAAAHMRSPALSPCLPLLSTCVCMPASVLSSNQHYHGMANPIPDLSKALINRLLAGRNLQSSTEIHLQEPGLKVMRKNF